MEIKLKNYEEGYSPPNSVKIYKRVKKNSQGNPENWNACWNGPNNTNNRRIDKAPELEENMVQEIGIEDAKKWSRDWKQQSYIELWWKTGKEKEATRKRIAESNAKGEKKIHYLSSIDVHVKRSRFIRRLSLQAEDSILCSGTQI